MSSSERGSCSTLRNIRSSAGAITCLAKTRCSAAVSTACRTRSEFGSTPRRWRNTFDFCPAAICATRSRTSSIPTMVPSSTGTSSWLFRQAQLNPPVWVISGNWAGRRGWHPIGPQRKTTGVTPDSILQSAWSGSDDSGWPATREAPMADINLEAVAGNLNRVGYEALFKALRQAKGAGNRNVELAHWLVHILQGERTDIVLTADHFKLDRNKLLMDINAAISGFRKNETEMPTVSNTVMDLLDRGWHYATLFFGETQIRTGHVLVGAMQSRELDRALKNISSEFNKMSIDVLTSEYRKIWATSEEETIRPMDGSGLGTVASAAQQTGGAKGTTPLDRFSQDLTAKARSGEMDPILGRDEEIRQLIDVLMRRRQNNPILTGEAGVRKTAVVEGFAQRIASGEVPPPLKDVTLRVLDIGLLQAGAGVRGEFESRLRAVIDEVQASPRPIILFIDEAHTLIGAGGPAGTGDAANLLKPALARGTLRTIAATTWLEYQKYFEKDPALTRRFQPIQVDEPDVAQCCDMLRGILKPMEKHHNVRISDAAIVAAVSLSHRYIPARQLPDKAVSLLDTASARVAISQSATPAMIEDARVAIAAREAEKAALVSDGDLGTASGERIGEIDSEIGTLKEKLAALQTEWDTEQKLVTEIRSLREILNPKDADAKEAAAADAPDA